MTSEQKKTDADSKKQSNESSATMEIFADDDVDKKNNKKQEPPQRNMKPVNSNILADASNKSEMQQEQLPQQAFYKKKKGYQKKKGFQKKKFENKNKTLWNPNNKNTGTTDDRHQNWNNKSNARNHYYPDDYHHGRNNHQDYLRYEEANMAVNQNVSTGFQPVPPFSRYIRGSDHTFPVPHPQQQKHLFADDGNNKVLLEQNSNGSLVYSDDRDHVVNHNGSFNGTEYSSWSQSPLSRHSWVNMLENNTQIECVVLKRGGESMLVPIPPNVGACLVQELLVQKESFMASAQQRSDPKAYTNIETDQGRPAEGNVGTSGVGDQGRAPSSSFANHQASSVVEHGGAYPMVNTPGHPHCRSYHHQGHNNHTDPNLHYEVYVPTLNPQQPYNGYGSFPPVGNNGEVHMGYPMMQPHNNYPPMYSLQYQGMTPPPQALGGAFHGYTRPNDFHANGEHTEPSSDKATRGEVEGRGNGHHNPSIDRNNMEATPNRSDINQGDIAEGGNNPQVHNHNAVTPHRVAVVANGEVDPRRVSFSPLVSFPHTPANASN